MSQTVKLTFPAVPFLRSRGRLYLPDEHGQIDANPDHVADLKVQGCSDPVPEEPAAPAAVDLPPVPGLAGIPWSAAGAEHPGTGIEGTPVEVPVAAGELGPPAGFVQEAVPPDPQAAPDHA